MQKQIDTHERKIKSMEKSHALFRESVNGKLETIMNTLNKPFLSDRQMIGVFISLAVYLVVSVTYVNKIEARSSTNFESIKKSEKADTRMFELLIDIQKKLSRIEGQKDAEYNSIKKR